MFSRLKNLPDAGPLIAILLVCVLTCLGIALRYGEMTKETLWVDEAESSINALTILEQGVPTDHYLGIPLYENTLSEPWPEHPEYEFRDSSYSKKRGVVVYHGWLPLYAIAASQALFGIQPDPPEAVPRIRHGPESLWKRTVVPRLPGFIASVGAMLAAFFLLREVGGTHAGLVALTWMALAHWPIELGPQARYYGLTLLLITLVVWALRRTVTNGGWRAFIALGLAEGLLFHTHQLSSLAFAVASACAFPPLLRHSRWLWKCSTAAGLAAILTVPWAFWSGFFETATGVPKIFKLFEGPEDWLRYLRERLPAALAACCMLAAPFAAGAIPRVRESRIAQNLREHRGVYFFLGVWMLATFAAFHTLVPAASFFVERLTLMLWLPFVFTISLFVGDLTRRLRGALAPVLVLAISVGSIAAIHRLPHQPRLGGDVEVSRIAPLMAALGTIPFDEDTRLYSSPNDHLTAMYYTGLPVQSAAPVRPPFFLTHPGGVTFIQHRFVGALPEEFISKRAEKAGVRLLPGEIRLLENLFRKHVLARKQEERSLPAPTLPPIPEFARPIFKEYRELQRSGEQTLIRKLRARPFFRGIELPHFRDYWDAFFVRFLDYEERVAENHPILPRLRNAEVFLLPQSGIVLHYSPQPPQSPAGTSSPP